MEPKFLRRLNIEYKKIAENPNSPYKVELVNGNIQDWRVQIKCPDDTPYQGLTFVLRITIPVSSPSTSHP